MVVARTLITVVMLALLVGCGGAETKTGRAPTRNQQGSDFVGIYADDVYFGDAAYRRKALAAMHDAGVRLIRQPFAWADFKRDPKRFDDFVAAATDAGIRVLPVLLGPDPGAPGGAGAIKPPDPDRFAEWAAQMVQRYRTFPISAWQVWNEPNIPAFWSPKPDPAAYARLLQTTGAAIRKADPKA